MFTLTHDKVARLTRGMSIGPFDCDDADLNGFLRDDANDYLVHLLAVTYLVFDAGRLIAFFSLSNDKLAYAPEEDGSKTTWNQLQRDIPNEKRRKSHPAVKIGRLGVCSELQGRGIGSQILDYLKILFLTGNRTGCRFITVDANNNPRATKFYQENDFRFLSSGDAREDTRQMFFDLKNFADLMAIDPLAPVGAS